MAAISGSVGFYCNYCSEWICMNKRNKCYCEREGIKIIIPNRKEQRKLKRKQNK